MDAMDSRENWAHPRSEARTLSLPHDQNAHPGHSLVKLYSIMRRKMPNHHNIIRLVAVKLSRQAKTALFTSLNWRGTQTGDLAELYRL
jgi:hypothetical protein